MALERAAAPSDGYEDTDLFSSVMFGYDKAQVDSYIDAICDELSILASEVKRLTPVEAELAERKDEVDRLRRGLVEGAPVTAVSEQLRQALTLVDAEVSAMRQEAETLLADARTKATATLRSAREDSELLATQRRKEAQAAYAEIIEQAHVEAARLREEATIGAKPRRRRPA